MHDTDAAHETHTHNVIRRDILRFSSGRFFGCVSHSGPSPGPYHGCSSYHNMIPYQGVIPYHNMIRNMIPFRDTYMIYA